MKNEFPVGSNRSEKLAYLVNGIRNHAAMNKGTEWDLLPESDADVIALIWTGRKLASCIAGIAPKLRVLKSGVAPFDVVAKLTHEELVAIETAKEAQSTSVVDQLIARLTPETNLVKIDPPTAEVVDVPVVAESAPSPVVDEPIVETKVEEVAPTSIFDEVKEAVFTDEFEAKKHGKRRH
jgi:hypothetical protein